LWWLSRLWRLWVVSQEKGQSWAFNLNWSSEPACSSERLNIIIGLETRHMAYLPYYPAPTHCRHLNS
jgi:hypothetical protein